MKKKESNLEGALAVYRCFFLYNFVCYSGKWAPFRLLWRVGSIKKKVLHFIILYLRNICWLLARVLFDDPFSTWKAGCLCQVTLLVWPERISLIFHFVCSEEIS